MSSAAHALLREIRYYNDEAGREMWMLMATSNAGERWTARHEDYDQGRGRAGGADGV